MPDLNLGRVKGDKGDTGEQGVSVTGLELKETLGSGNKVYSLVLSNGSKLDFEVPRGAVGETGATGAKGEKGDKGDKGVGIRGIELTRTETSGNKVYSHILTDNTKLEFEVPKGEVGATGAKGDKGDQGVQGVGIDTFRYKGLAEDGSFIYTVTLTNGETYDLTSPIGPKGDKGDKGEPGKTIALSLNSQDIIDNHRIFAKALDDGADLNNITAPGFYRKDLDIKNIANSPIERNSYILIVTKIQPDNEQYVTQIAQQYDAESIFIRHKDYEWRPWKRLTTTDDITWDNLGGKPSIFPSNWGNVADKPSSFPPASHTHPYLSTTGGTINGSLTVTGQIVSNGDVTAFSDIALKENIKPLEDNLLDRLQVYSYNYKGKSDIRYGVIAQELQEIYPNLVLETDTEVDGRKALAVRDRDIIYLLVDSYKKLLKRTEELERK